MMLGIVLGVALVVLGSFQNMPQVYNNTLANTTVLSVMSSYSVLVGWLPIIVVIVAVAIILGLLGFGFGGSGGRTSKR
jgi:hypothetical protein